MKKILIFRSIRPETMGFLVKDILNEFGQDSEVSILTRPENVVTMEAIPEVKEVVCFSGNTFDVSNDHLDEIKSLKQLKYDLTIIPTSGNIDSYDNVLNFSRKVFKSTSVYYYQFGGEFKKYDRQMFKVLTKNIIKGISFGCVFPVMMFYFIAVLYYKLLTKNM